MSRAIGAGAIRVNTDDFEPLVDMLVTKRPIPASAIGFGWSELWFATCPDNQNAYQNDAWEEGTRALLPRAFSVHAKISGYEPDGTQTFVAMDGTKRRQDLSKFLIITRESGYRGPLFFEYNFAENDERIGAAKGLVYLRSLSETG